MTSLMNELGLQGEKITLEHTLVLATSKALEAQLKGTSRQVTNAIEIVGYGVAAYCVLSGFAKIISAWQSPRPTKGK